MNRHVFSLLFLLPACAAHADGPHIAFHGTSGNITVTLFSAPDPLVAGPVDLALLVQNTSDSAVTPGASAHGELTLAGHTPVAFTLKPGNSASGQLLGATVPLSAAGDYTLILDVQAGSSAHFSGDLPVEINNGRRNTVLWTVCAPTVLILLFLINQYAKQKLRRVAPTADPSTTVRSA